MEQQEEQSNDEEMACGATLIESLEGSSGISSADVKKLKEAGYYTVESIAYETRRGLVAIKGITEQKADKLINEGEYISSIHIIISECL